MNRIDQFDAQLFLFLNELGSEKWDLLWLSITNKWYSIPIYVVLLVLVIKYFGLKKTGVVLVLVAALIASTDQFANLFKYGFERPRPCQVDALVEQGRFIAGRCGRYGFFSAHAASSMALAFFMGLLLKKHNRYAFPLLLFWAVLVGYSRIYVGVHYPGDVLTGFVIGALLGFIYYRIYMFINARYFAGNDPKTV